MLEPTLRVVTLDQLPLPEGRDRVMTSDAAVRVLREQIGTRDRECFVVIHVDSQNRIISMETISVGSLSSSIVHPREVFKGALLQNAAAIICAHNHPSNDPTPSREDRNVYERLKRAGELLGVVVLDFLVITASGFNSMVVMSEAS